MNVLILINWAHEHRPFYKHVGDQLAARGHKVHYAVDSHCTDYIFPDVDLGPDTHYFSDFFANHYDHCEVPPEFQSTNLWTAVFPDIDRYSYSRAAYRRAPGYYEKLVPNLLMFFTKLFDKHSFNVVVYENVSNAFSYMAYEVAKKRGAKFLGFTASRIPNRMDVLDTAYARNTEMPRIFAGLVDGSLTMPSEVRTFVDEYLQHFDQKVPDYVRNPHPFHMNPVARYLHFKPALRFARALRYRLIRTDDFPYAFQVAEPMWAFPEQFVREVYRVPKLSYIRARYYRQSVDLSRKYFVYPIQLHPESATSVDGPYYNDELSTITNIAINLPYGLALYVKDHRHAAARQPIDFYRRVSQLPNVTLLDPNYDTKALLRNAQAVVLNTSTMGYEALVLGKPVFVLGNPCYDFHPMCIKIPSFNEAFNLFSRYTEYRAEPRHIEALVASYVMCSYDTPFDLFTRFNDPALIKCVASIIEKETTSYLAMRDKEPRPYTLISVPTASHVHDA